MTLIEYSPFVQGGIHRSIATIDCRLYNFENNFENTNACCIFRRLCRQEGNRILRQCNEGYKYGIEKEASKSLEKYIFF